jgi:DNA polymerase-1
LRLTLCFRSTNGTMKMKTFDVTLDSSACVVRVVESDDDRRKFEEWLSAQRIVAFDTETSGLDIYSPHFRAYTVQFGNATEAWVLNVARWRAMIQKALISTPFLIAHNAPFDMLVVDRHVGVSLEKFEGRILDTRILAHLLDPRTEMEGGSGHSLKRLAAIWVDASAPDSEQALKDRFRELKATVDTGWAIIDEDDPILLKYAGVDTLLTFRVFEVLRDLCKQAGFQSLVDFEHRLQWVVCLMQRKGMRLDVAYTERLRERLQAESVEFSKVATRYGITSINSTAQVATALTAMGETLSETTPSGAAKVDKAVLLPLADLDRDWKRIGAREPNPLADAILRAKRAEKWDTAYAQAFLDLKDADDRLHPWIGTLQARTARMSVSRPPLQQLPSSDWMVRRCFVADPGQTMISIDYSQIEMRVLAGLAGDKQMINAIKSGTDLHDFTAGMLFGDDFTSKQRKIAKGVAFGKVYGGGAETLSRQTGADIASVRQAIKAYDQTYLGIARYSRSLQSRAEHGAKEVVTPSGRHLPLDRDRLYAATNYIVQSTARDVLAQAIVNMHEVGLGEHFLLPIHDEVLGQAPIGEADDVVREMKKVMEQYEFMGVPLIADGEVIGSTWAMGYGYEEAKHGND